ncbi:hypothetical protein ACU686_29015 [Yinghuangia aomiensis]
MPEQHAAVLHPTGELPCRARLSGGIEGDQGAGRESGEGGGSGVEVGRAVAGSGIAQQRRAELPRAPREPGGRFGGQGCGRGTRRASGSAIVSSTASA